MNLLDPLRILFSLLEDDTKGKRMIGILGMSLLMGGCSHVAYYHQAMLGQLEIFNRAQPIPELLASSETSPQLKQKLQQVLKIRAFADQVLHLPVHDSYYFYADLERPFVVWNVFAAPPFTLTLKSWCFLVVGCLHYRGYFSQEAAQGFAEELRQQGDEVYVGGVSAYSTLGWFADPFLNTMLAWPSSSLAGVIFHELAHQQLYIPDDTSFNESFATAVEHEGVKRWLASLGNSKDMLAYQESYSRQQEFVALISRFHEKLNQLYQQPWPDAQLQAQKQAHFKALRKAYAQLKKSWNGLSGYDAWFAQDLNNAKLLSVMTYQNHVPAFQALLIQHGGDLPSFYRAATQLGQLPIEQRRAQLQKLSPQPS